MITASNLVIKRGGSIIIDGVDIVIDNKKTIGIVGPNGAGKSTLLQGLYRALPASAGEIILDQDNIVSLRRRQIASRIAVLSQHSEASLPLSVRDAVGLGRLAHRSLIGYGDKTDRECVEAALTKVDMLCLADRLITELSGGERQRMLIARAIVQDADHLLLDEPTNHLDLHYQFSLLRLVKQLKAAVVVVLHDLNLAARCCDELLLLQNGNLVAAGTPATVLDPELISQVYQVKVNRIEFHERIQLLFDPLDDYQETPINTNSPTSQMCATSLIANNTNQQFLQ